MEAWQCRASISFSSMSSLKAIYRAMNGYLRTPLPIACCIRCLILILTVMACTLPIQAEEIPQPHTHVSLRKMTPYATVLPISSHQASTKTIPSQDRPIVVIDPGHGGDDWGVDPAESGLLEKRVVLDLSQRLKARLAAHGTHVYLTRTTDRFISLGARVRFANALLFRPNNDPDIGRLISIHLNSNKQNPKLQRVEVLVDPQSETPQFAVEMAQALQQATQGGFGYRDAGYPPGVHPGDLAPVRWTYPRGQNVLTEAAFLSNPAQAASLHDPAFLDRIAQAYGDAFERTLP